MEGKTLSGNYKATQIYFPTKWCCLLDQWPCSSLQIMIRDRDTGVTQYSFPPKVIGNFFIGKGWNRVLYQSFLTLLPGFKQKVLVTLICYLWICYLWIFLLVDYRCTDFVYIVVVINVDSNLMHAFLLFEGFMNGINIYELL